MEEAFKGKLILILVVLCAILFITTMSSCSSLRKLKSARDEEIIKRLDSEERLSKYSTERKNLEDRAKAASEQLEEEKAAFQATKKALLQEQLVNQSLKEELAKVTKLKEALEEDLKEALTGKKSKR